MHFHGIPTFLLPLIATLIITHVPNSSCSDYRYSNCSQTFQCGNVPNIGYPFWGLNRPDYCGWPEFELSCSGDAPELTILSQKFRVLNIINSSYTLNLTRADYWGTYCPSDGEFANTTIDTSFFTYTSNTQSLFLYYKCQTLEITVASQIFGLNLQFSCVVDDKNTTGYYVTRNISSTGVGALLGSCETNVNVPVYQENAQVLENNLTTSHLLEALDGGFGLKWDANNSLCEVCVSSGGLCGYNSSTQKFTCYCKDQPYLGSCGSTQPNTLSGKSSKGVALGIGIAIGGAGIVGILASCLYCYFIHKKKKQIDSSKSKEDILGAPSGKSLSTTNASAVISQSQSVPSFPYPKSVDTETGGSTYFGVQVFSYQELEEATNNFDSSRELGDGGFGTVYYGQLNDGQIVAVKRLYENNITRVKQFLNEVEILTHLQHDNLVKLHGCTSRRSRELLLVYEYIPNGTVADHLHGKRAKYSSLSWSVRLGIAVETADALAYLHASDVIHRDVKTTNILLDNDFRVKVADFGLSRLFPADVTHVSTAPQGTPGYVDPEYYQCYQLTDKSDVFSFGVVLVELISAKQAVDVNRHRTDINLANMAINKIQNKTLHELVDPSLGYERDYNIKKMTTAVAELAFRCLQQEKEMRPSMGEVLKVLKEIKNEDLSLRKAEVLDMSADDVGVLKSEPPPISPESNETDKWVGDQSQPHSI